jgi:glycerol uptake facilitator-like aquaporin
MASTEPKVKSVLAVPKLPSLGQKLLAEFLGTFFVVFATCCVNDLWQKNNQGAMAVGLAVVMLVYSLGHISAYFNPAVMFAALLGGFLSKKEFGLFVIVQLIGGWIGSLIAYSFEGHSDFPVMKPVNDNYKSVIDMFVAELIGTMFLAFFALQCCFSKQRGNQFYGLAVGCEVLSISYAIGKISGASLNPVMVTCLQLTHAISKSAAPLKWWIVYMVAEFTGALLAYVFFALMGSWHPDDKVNFSNEEQDENEPKGTRISHYSVQDEAASKPNLSYS